MIARLLLCCTVSAPGAGDEMTAAPLATVPPVGKAAPVPLGPAASAASGKLVSTAAERTEYIIHRVEFVAVPARESRPCANVVLTIFPRIDCRALPDTLNRLWLTAAAAIR
jgi:hypothetical protein